MTTKKITIIFSALFFFFLFCTNCSLHDKDRDTLHLEKYFENLPQEENENESIHNKEILLTKIKNHYSNQDYYSALEVLETSYTTFSENDGGDEVDYYFGIIISHLIQTDEMSLIDFLKNKDSDKRLFYKSKIISSIQIITNTNADTGTNVNLTNKNHSEHTSITLTNDNILYNQYHLKNVYQERHSYDLEKKALEKIYPYYLEKLDISSNKLEAKKNISNINAIYQWAIRYPDISFLKSVIKNSNYIKQKWLPVLQQTNIPKSKKYKDIQKKWQDISKLITLYQDNLSEQIEFAEFAERYYFGYTNSLIVRNRTHPIRSRNLATLEGWTSYRVLQENILGEDEKQWVWVSFWNDEGKEAFGFVESTAHQEAIFLSLDKKEQEMYKNYYQKDYFLVLKYLTRFLLSNKSNTKKENITKKEDRIKKELQYVLFYQALAQIGKRATSLDNVYTDYIKKYPRYFRANKDYSELIVNQQILLALLQDFPNSKMTLYFRGW